jgi:hypothetical protein
MTSLIDIARDLGSERQCLEYLQGRRWPEGLACLRCGSTSVSRSEVVRKARRDKKDGTKKGDPIGLRFIYDCRETECGYQFTATTGTVFHDSHLPLSTWFLAIALMLNAKKSLSALQLKRDLGLGSYKTAWHLAHRIRSAMEQGGGLFRGVVEVDETYIGGKYDKRRKRQRWQKQPVVGLVQRAMNGEPSQVRSFAIERATKALLVGAVTDNVSTDAKMVCTDENTRYKAIEKSFRRRVVNHIREEYAKRVDGALITTNGIENFWSLFKRALVGQYHHVSVKHLPRYLDEATYKFNYREAANVFVQTVDRILRATPLPLADLTAPAASE